jgi:very-short-patch-repair endonuclease
VARVDLAFPEQRVAIEYDGAWHAERGQFTKDRRRLNALVAVGWTVLHVTAADMRDPEALIAEVRALLDARNSGEVVL